MPQVRCAFSSPERYVFVPDNTVKTVDLSRVEIPQCPLILMDDNKSISFPVDVNTNASIGFNISYDTPEMNFELLYGAFFIDHGHLVPFLQFLWRQDITRHGPGGLHPSHISGTAQVNVPSNTIWQIGFRVSPNVADNIRIQYYLISFEPWTSSPGKLARR